MLETKKQKVIVYSSPDCAYCYTVKGYLKENDIEYQEINIYEDKNAYDKMIDLSGQKDVPVTVIGDQVIIGWDKDEIKKALEIL